MRATMGTSHEGDHVFVGNYGSYVHAYDARSGENRVQVNSLLRVYGTVIQGEYDREGGPILQGQYYRHWPRGEYVTSANASAMRR